MKHGHLIKREEIWADLHGIFKQRLRYRLGSDQMLNEF
jgi:hypothetical protein